MLITNDNTSSHPPQEKKSKFYRVDISEEEFRSTQCGKLYVQFSNRNSQQFRKSLECISLFVVEEQHNQELIIAHVEIVLLVQSRLDFRIALGERPIDFPSFIFFFVESHIVIANPSQLRWNVDLVMLDLPMATRENGDFPLNEIAFSCINITHLTLQIEHCLLIHTQIGTHLCEFIRHRFTHFMLVRTKQGQDEFLIKTKDKE